MTTFERELAAELGQMAGPGRQIDAAAMARTATTQSPKWRFGSMFSATKFVVAGAIVALFGGFLLAGVLTQPSEESAPAVGASASATVQPALETITDSEPAPDSDAAEQTGLTTPAGTFTSVESLAGAPIGTSTLLPDGRVLVVGDTRAEVWDPATGSRSPAGSMGTFRPNHAAVGLADGRVLIVSEGEYPALPSAEVWDPATESFSPAGSFSEWHSGLRPSLTLLPDGRVLVMGGGEHHMDATQVVEVWDPQTEAFQVAGEMAYNRAEQTATLLQDGRVLVVGGETEEPGARETGLSPLALAEVWDPATDSFSPAGSLSEGRAGHTATLLQDGRVLIIGGGDTYDQEMRSAEIWDPATEAFSPAGSLHEERIFHTATLLPDGRVLVIGGSNIVGQNVAYPASAEVWDSATMSFSPAGSLVRPRRWHSATLLPDGRVLVTGRLNAEIWEPATDEPPAHANATASPTPELLPGVDLVTEEVKPGVYRVLGDGTGRSLDDLQVLFVASDGTVWAGRDKRVLRLGVPGSSSRLKRTFNWYEFSVSNTGNLRARHQKDGLLELRDGRWVKLDTDPDTDKPYPVHPDASGWQGLPSGLGVHSVRSGPFLASDGSWWFGLADMGVPEVLRYTPDEVWERLALQGAQGTAFQFMETSDGTIWAIGYMGGPGSALFEFDGERWARVEIPDGETEFNAQSLRLDSRGGLVVNGMLFDTHPARRVDILREDSGWVVAPFVGLEDQYPVLEKADLDLLGDDGTGWAIAEDGKFLIYIDDDGATRVDVPFRAAAITPGIRGYATAPDGSLWFTIRSDHPSGNSSIGEGLYVVTPEAVSPVDK